MTTNKAEHLPSLNPDAYPEPMRDVVRWHLLMTEADDVTTATGWGLSNVWGHVHEGDYEGARATLDDLKQDLAKLFPGALDALSPSRGTRSSTQ